MTAEQLPLAYPVQFGVDYPQAERNRLTVAFRIVLVIPALIVLAVLNSTRALLFLPPLLLILFRNKYPRWWFDWNLELTRFLSRVNVYAALMDDRYPSTDEQQSVKLEIVYPDVRNELNRWLPLIKWFLALPHYFVLALLILTGVVCVLLAWFAILFTGRYPRGLFDFLVGVGRWNLRVMAYAFLLTTDRYPPFSLAP